MSTLPWSWTGVDGSRDSLVLWYMWQGGAYTHLSRVRRGEILQSEKREVGSPS